MACLYSKHKFVLPKFELFRRVHFMDHRGKKLRLGTIQQIVTHYTKNKYYHIYSIEIEGSPTRRRLHVGEENVKNLVIIQS